MTQLTQKLSSKVDDDNINDNDIDDYWKWKLDPVEKLSSKVEDDDIQW